MKKEDFGKSYLANETKIRKILQSRRSYDEDLLHDTYIALYEHSQHADIQDFVRTFVAFYSVRYKRRSAHERCYDACEDTTILRQYDRPEESDLAYREGVCAQVDEIIESYSAHPLPGERNHKQACKILQLYRQGMSFGEIAQKMKMSKQSVQQLLSRTIEKLRVMCREQERYSNEC